MSAPYRIVAPFLPLPLEAEHHRELHDFDWIGAIRMMSDSATRACHVPVHVLTDVEATLPFPMFRYATTQRRLMLWSLEICAAYLESDDFDRNTVMLDVDQLVYRDLGYWFAPRMDLGILIRPTPKGVPGLPILNGCQFWSYRGKKRLADFYRAALEIAKELPEDLIAWGADTVALERLLEPLKVGLYQRSGLSVRLIESTDVLHALSRVQIRQLADGTLPPPIRAVIDFRRLRKRYLSAFYEATLGARVEVAQ